MALGVYLSASLRALARIRPGNDLACAHGARPDLIVYPPRFFMRAGPDTAPIIGIAMVGEVTGFLHIVRVDGPIDPVTAEYRIAFAPLGGRLRSRHAVVHGLDRLTAFLRQAHVPTPEIERAWRALATRRVHSIPRVGLTPTQIEALGL